MSQVQYQLGKFTVRLKKEESLHLGVRYSKNLTPRFLSPSLFLLDIFLASLHIKQDPINCFKRHASNPA